MNACTNLIFECFELDFEGHELLKEGQVVKVEPQVFDLLWYFSKNAGRLISKDDIIENVWNGRIVSDAAISTRINGARVAIDDSGAEQRIIRTIPRRGFRFLGEVSEAKPTVSALREVRHPNPPASKNLLHARPAIAIMPFEAIGGSQELAELADGMRIDIQNALIKVSGLFLTAVGSVNAVQDKDPLEAAKALNARYLLTGQLRRAKDQLRLSIQVLDSEENSVLLSDQFDHTLEDTFIFLDEITAEILETLNVALIAGEPARIWHKTLKDVQSLSIFYRGVSNFFKMTRESLPLARESFEKIARHHPDLAIGYTWVALVHWFELQRGWSDDKGASQKMAREFAEKAVLLPDTDGQAHTVLSHVYLLEEKFDDALEAGKQAVANRPSCTNANAFHANVLHYCGRNSDALSHIRLALQQSPFSPVYFKLVRARSLLALGNIDDAESALDELLSSASQDIQVQLLGCQLAVKQDRKELASEYVRNVLQIEPSFQVSEYLALEPYQDKGFKDEMATGLMQSGLPN